MLPVSLYCPLLIAPSVFSNAYLVVYYSLQHMLHHRISLSFEHFFLKKYSIHRLHDGLYCMEQARNLFEAPVLIRLSGVPDVIVSDTLVLLN